MVSSNPNLSKSFLKSNVVLLLGTVVFALLFLEVAIRFTSPQATYRNFTQIDAPVFQNSETLPWTLKPHSEGRQVSPYGEFDIFIEINAHGLRGPETETSKGLQRILFLGDSFTFGHGVEEKKTYPRLVETLLNGRLKNKKYEILNAGYADAYSPDSYFVYLKGNLKKLDPRAVVLGFYLRNDIVDLSSTIWKRTNAEGLPDKIVSPKYWIDPYGRRRRPKAGILKMDFVYQIHIFLNMYSHLYVFVTKTINNAFFKKYKSPVFSDNWPPETVSNWGKMQKVLKATYKLLQSEGIPLLIVFINSRIQTVDSLWDEYEETYSSHSLNRKRTNQELLAFCKSNKILCLDLFDAFYSHPQPETLYFDMDGHWNEKGHSLAAQKIRNFIKKRIFN